MISYKIVLLFVPILTTLAKSDINDALNSFAIKLLQATSEEANSINLALSPYTVWTLLSIISEGARGNTARELEIGLNVPSDKTEFRNEYKVLSAVLTNSTPGVTLELSNGIFTNKKHVLKDGFQRTVKDYYNVDVMPVDFKNLKPTTELINNYIANATNNRIKNLISPDDLRDAEIFLTSTLYFKGEWRFPFNRTATKKQPFYNEKGEQKGEVDMMNFNGFVPFIRIESIKSQVVLLPYGIDEKMGMVVILPFKGSNVEEVLKLLNDVPVSSIIQKLKTAELMFAGDEINIFLPKFSITSDLNLNVALQRMGIREVFDSQKADLLGMFQHYLFISRLIQKAEIEVNEEGTVASAAAAASAVYKMPSPRFIANRPFIYAIVDGNGGGSVIFEGIFRNAGPLA